MNGRRFHHLMPNGPVAASERFRGKSAGGLYGGAVEAIDWSTGEIIRTINDLGLQQDTIVVFTSDHGNCLGIHDHMTKNVPEEESMRIPLLIRYPGKLLPRHEDLLISVPDLYPTLLDLMGLGEHIPRSVEGTSHAELLLAGEGRRPTSQLYLWAPCDQPSMGRRGVRTRQYTLVVDQMPGKKKQLLFYDRAADPGIREQNPWNPLPRYQTLLFLIGPPGPWG